MLCISLARKALQAANVSGSSATGFTARSMSMQTKTIRPLSMRRRLAMPVAAAAFAGAALVYMSEVVHAQPEKPMYSRGSIESRMNLVEPKTILRARKEDDDAEDEDPAHDADTGGNADAIENAEEAFDERTGEINWDCPCLGGMADGPCGETFKAAFSCFVFSEQEPKGIDCVDKFKLMQDCFRKHPEVYAEEIKADNEAEAEADNAVAEESYT